MHDHAKRTGCCPHWARPGIFMLCRWEVMALTHARLAVYLDLDVEVLPSWSFRLLPAAVGASGAEAEARKATEDWLSNELDTYAPGASVGYEHAARTSLPRTVRTRGAGRLAPRPHALHVLGTRPSLGRTHQSTARRGTPGCSRP